MGSEVNLCELDTMAHGSQSANNIPLVERWRNHWLREIIATLAAIGGIVAATWAIIQLYAHFKGPVIMRQDILVSGSTRVSAITNQMESNGLKETLTPVSSPAPVIHTLTDSKSPGVTSTATLHLPPEYLFTIVNQSDYLLYYQLGFEWGDWSPLYALAGNSQACWPLPYSHVNIAFNPGQLSKHPRRSRLYSISTFAVCGHPIMGSDWTNAPSYYFQMCGNGEVDLFSCNLHQ